MKDLNNHLRMFEVFKTCSEQEKSEIMEVYDELEKKGKILVDNYLRKYQNGKAASVFNEFYLTSLCENLKIEVANKVRTNKVDKKGMWNYLAKAFNNKCQDYYNSEINTQTRGGVDHAFISNENKDKIDHENSVNFEDSVIRIKEIENITNYLKHFDSPKKPYSTIIKMLLEGYSLTDIQKEMPFSPSTLERHKRKACELILLSNEFDRDRMANLIPETKLNFLYLKPKENPIKLEESVYKEYSFNKKNIVGELKYRVEVKSYEHGKNKSLNKETIVLKKVKGDSKSEIDEFLIDLGYERKKERLKKKISKDYNV